MKRMLAMCVLGIGLSACGGGNPRDATPPSLNAPNAAQLVTSAGIHPIVVHADDNVELDRVEFYRNGELIGVDTRAPFTWSLPVTAGMNGTHTLSAIAYDRAGNASESSWQLSVNVPDPLLSIPLPNLQATVPVTVEVPASTDPHVVYLDENLLQGAALPPEVARLVGDVTLSGTARYTESTPGTSEVRRIGVFVRPALDPLPPECFRVAKAVVCTGNEIGQQVGVIDFTGSGGLSAPFVLGGPVLRDALTSNPARLHLGFQVSEGKLNEGDSLLFTDLSVGAGLP